LKQQVKTTDCKKKLKQQIETTG